MSIELTPEEVDLLYYFAENPEIEIDDETKKKFIKAAKEGFTAEMTLSLEHPITIKRLTHIEVMRINNA